MSRAPVAKDRSPFALSGAGLVAAYLVLVLAPLAIVWLDVPSGGGFFGELGSAFALVGYAMLLMQFFLIGRFRAINGRVGIDVVLRLHQALARVLTVLLIAHPFLYGVTRLGTDPASYVDAVTGMFTGAPFASGVVAWVLLLVLMILALWRARLPFTYETWRAGHGVLALLIAAGGLHHAYSIGGFTGAPQLRALWLVLFVLAAATLARVYVFTPLAQRRYPWRVADVRALGPGRWLLALEPRGRALDFRAGQFVWLKLAPHPFTLRENPFSIVSAPDAPRVEFLIREAGDATSAMGAVQVGSPAWLDGPHGAFTLDAARTAQRIVMLAGGVGLAPCLSMLRAAAVERDGRTFHLVYANRSEDQAVLRAEIDALADRLDLRVDFVLSEPPPGWTGTTGLMDGATLLPLFVRDGPDAAYFVCGPPPMVAASMAALRQIGVPAARVITEKFNYD